jgi:hypothetical protein
MSYRVTMAGIPADLRIETDTIEEFQAALKALEAWRPTRSSFFEAAASELAARRLEEEVLRPIPPAAPRVGGGRIRAGARPDDRPLLERRIVEELGRRPTAAHTLARDLRTSRWKVRRALDHLAALGTVVRIGPYSGPGAAWALPRPPAEPGALELERVSPEVAAGLVEVPDPRRRFFAAGVAAREEAPPVVPVLRSREAVAELAAAGQDVEILRARVAIPMEARPIDHRRSPWVDAPRDGFTRQQSEKGSSVLGAEWTGRRLGS